MMVPGQAVDLIKRWEGFHKVVTHAPVPMVGPYLCPALVPTIGYGTVIPSMDHPPITEPRAVELALTEMERNVASCLRLCPVLAGEPDRRLAALVSFVYNLGAGRLKTSTLRLRVNESDWEEATREIRRWVWAGGRKLAGLVGRREAEAALLA